MRENINTACISILTVVVIFAALRIGQGIFAPVISALVLGIVLTPLSDLWTRLHVPESAAALLTVLLALSLIFALIVMLEPSISEAIEKAPIIQAELRETIEEARRLLRGLEKVSEDMAAAIDPNEGGNGEDNVTDGVTVPSITDALFYAPQFLGQFLIFSGTLYFFLLSRNAVYDWLSTQFAALGQRDLRRAAHLVSRYVLTISTINLGLGVVVAIVMYFIGMPSPIVWGLLAFVLNFILYLGPAFLAGTLLIAGIVAFDGAASFLPMAVYLAMNATEAQFVTPTMVGKRLAVNPLLVFLSLVFWLWLWGPVGGIIAIPILIWTITVVQGISEDQKIRSEI